MPSVSTAGVGLPIRSDLVSEGWGSVRIDSIDAITVAGGLQWRPLRRTLGIGAFGINAYTAASPGDLVVEEHTEQQLRHEEVYVVVSGRATFTLDGETVDAPAGTLVFVRDPAVRRGARAAEPRTTVIAVGGKPGEPYTASAWEWYFFTERFRAAGEWDAGVADLEQGLDEFPDHPGMLYSLACYEALAGRREAALAHLRRAVELDPRLADYAGTDTDLDAIRDDPAFPPDAG